MLTSRMARQRRRFSLKSDPVRVRPTRLEDIPKVSDLTSDDGLNDGEHIFRLYYSNTKRIWRVAENESGEIVGSQTSHELPIKEKKIICRDHLKIRSDYQGQGIARKLWKIYDDIPTVGLTNEAAMAKMGHWYSKSAETLVGYVGKPNMEILKRMGSGTDFPSFTVLPLQDEEDMSEHLAYDRTILGLDRSHYVSEWCRSSAKNEPFAQTVIAKQNSRNGTKIVGYGTIRLFSITYQIQPLYANSDQIAAELLKELIKVYVQISDGRPVGVYFNARNSFMTELVKHLNMERGHSHLRTYTSGADGKDIEEELKRIIAHDKVYCLQYYWPV